MFSYVMCWIFLAKDRDNTPTSAWKKICCVKFVFFYHVLPPGKNLSMKPNEILRA